MGQGKLAQMPIQPAGEFGRETFSGQVRMGHGRALLKFERRLSMPWLMRANNVLHMACNKHVTSSSWCIHTDCLIKHFFSSK